MNRSINSMKQAAANLAVSYIQSGTVVGLGSGSTARLAVQRLAEKLASDETQNIHGIPTSVEIEIFASQLGIPLTTLEEHPVIDVTIDGADEIDPDFQLIKGGGGALLREKIVAQASRRVIIIADESKRSSILGTHWPVPIEVLSFGWVSQSRFLTAIGGHPKVRLQEDGSAFKTDQGNIILDCDFGPIENLHSLALELDQRAGIIAHGLFLDIATEVILCGTDGCRHLTRAPHLEKERGVKW
ncbi:MAG: ribose-5-phosphate isomerase RpiA [Anaerolineales bacterium]|nr:ribose-5-phosphate isomerase RpiA [Anaerolineales bacterium]